MAMLKPEETLLGVNRNARAKPIVRPQAAPIARKAPPKVAGMTESVGTQRPTEDQKAFKPEPLSLVPEDRYYAYYQYQDDYRKYHDKKSPDQDYNRYVADQKAEYARYLESVKQYDVAIGIDKNPAATNASIRARVGATPTKTVLSR